MSGTTSLYSASFAAQMLTTGSGNIDEDNLSLEEVYNIIGAKAAIPNVATTGI